MESILPAGQDEVRQHEGLQLRSHKVEELGFIRKFADTPEAWEIRRILKAQLPVTELETLKQQLAAAVTAGAAGPGRGEHNG